MLAVPDETPRSVLFRNRAKTFQNLASDQQTTRHGYRELAAAYEQLANETERGEAIQAVAQRTPKSDWAFAYEGLTACRARTRYARIWREELGGHADWQGIANGVDVGGAVSKDCGNDPPSHQRLKALTTSHPRVAIHATVASKATTSTAMQSHPDRRAAAGGLVELAGSTTSGRSMWKGAFMTRLPEETWWRGRDRLWSPALVAQFGPAVHCLWNLFEWHNGAVPDTLWVLRAVKPLHDNAGGNLAGIALTILFCCSDPACKQLMLHAWQWNIRNQSGRAPHDVPCCLLLETFNRHRGINQSGAWQFDDHLEAI
jgi:hypothetical protein